MINNFIRFTILITLISFTSCETDSIYPTDNYALEIDSRLDTTINGIAKLKLNSTSNSIQTIHRITGKLQNNGAEPNTPQLVNWESSHRWVLNDTAYVFTRRTINYLGEWVTVDTIYVTGFSNRTVPTINPTSYSGTNGEINTVIAPIDAMKGDILTVRARYKDINKTIQIKLE